MQDLAEELIGDENKVQVGRMTNVWWPRCCACGGKKLNVDEISGGLCSRGRLSMVLLVVAQGGDRWQGELVRRTAAIWWQSTNILMAVLGTGGA